MARTSNICPLKNKVNEAEIPDGYASYDEKNAVIADHDEQLMIGSPSKSHIHLDFQHTRRGIMLKEKEEAAQKQQEIAHLYHISKKDNNNTNSNSNNNNSMKDRLVTTDFNKDDVKEGDVIIYNTDSDGIEVSKIGLVYNKMTDDDKVSVVLIFDPTFDKETYKNDMLVWDELRSFIKYKDSFPKHEAVPIKSICGFAKSAPGYEDICHLCGSTETSDRTGDIFICDAEGCCKGYHHRCLPVKYNRAIDKDESFKCPSCDTDNNFNEEKEYKALQGWARKTLFEKVTGELFGTHDDVDKSFHIHQGADECLLRYIPTEALMVRLCLLRLKTKEEEEDNLSYAVSKAHANATAATAASTSSSESITRGVEILLAASAATTASAEMNIQATATESTAGEQSARTSAANKKKASTSTSTNNDDSSDNVKVAAKKKPRTKKKVTEGLDDSDDEETVPKKKKAKKTNAKAGDKKKGRGKGGKKKRTIDSNSEDDLKLGTESEDESVGAKQPSSAKQSSAAEKVQDDVDADNASLSSSAELPFFASSVATKAPVKKAKKKSKKTRVDVTQIMPDQVSFMMHSIPPNETVMLPHQKAVTTYVVQSGEVMLEIKLGRHNTTHRLLFGQHYIAPAKAEVKVTNNYPNVHVSVFTSGFK